MGPGTDNLAIRATGRLALATLVVAAGCAGRAGPRADVAALLGEAGAAAPLPDGRWEDAELDEVLARGVRAETVLAAALARNPSLEEGRARVAAAAAAARAAGRLPEPQLKLEGWMVPLERPWAVWDAEMLMLGLSQELPARGARGARARAALADARASATEAGATAQELAWRVRRAWAEYYRADREVAIGREVLPLAEEVVELARAGYRVGRGTQQDVLRAAVAVSRVRAELVRAEQARLAAASLLNALMDRPARAPLGPPVEPPPPPVDEEAAIAALERELERRRPDVAVAEVTLAAARARADAARAEARWPAIMVGADYMLSPMGMERHGWGAMVSVNLPWLGAARRDEVERAARTIDADRRAVDAARLLARQELADAAARLRAARATARVLAEELLPAADRSWQAARSAFAAGQGDALGLLDSLRSLLDVRLEHARALAEAEASVADLYRAAGVGALDAAGPGTAPAAKAAPGPAGAPAAASAAVAAHVGASAPAGAAAPPTATGAGTVSGAELERKQP